MSFADLGLREPLLSTVAALGYSTPTPIQKQAIGAVLKGRDLLAAAQTGSGKTAGFALPILQKLAFTGAKVASNQVRALVLVPTRELAEQLLQSIQRYAASLPLRCYAVYGGVSINPQMMALRKGCDLLVATPGRLLDLYRQNAVRFEQLDTLVLDEADRMLDLGFARELDELFCALPKKRQTLFFSATFAERIRAMAGELLRDPLNIEVSPRNAAAQSVRQWLIPVDKKRKGELLSHLISTHSWQHLLIFAKTRKNVDALADSLHSQGLRVEVIHGERPQPARLRALEAFKQGAVDILVATDVAARGLDINGLPRVINFDMPVIAEDYVHRIGRTGRAGASGEAVSLVSADEVELLAAIETLTGQLIKRQEQEGFEPEHRLPQTTLGGAVLKKPKKPKEKLIPGAAKAQGTSSGKGKIHLGNWFEGETSKPSVKNVRKAPSFSKKPKVKP